MIVFEIPGRFRRRLYRNNDGFRSRRLAAFCLTSNRDERICLRKICCCAILRDRIRHDDKAVRVPFAILEMARQIDDLTRFEAKSGDVVGIEKNNTPFALDSAIAIAKVIDSRVELVMRTYSRQNKLPFCQNDLFERLRI